MSFNGVSRGKARHSRGNNLGLASVNNFSKLWVIGVVSSHLESSQASPLLSKNCLALKEQSLPSQ